MREWIDRLTEFLATRPLDGFGLGVTAGTILGVFGALVAAWLVGAVLVWVNRRIAARLHPEGVGPPRGVERTLRVGLLVLGAAGALRLLGIEPSTVLDAHLFRLGSSEVTVSVVVAAGLVLLFAYILSLVVRRALDSTGRGHDPLARSSLASVGRLLHYAIMAIGLVVAFETIGFDLKALLAVGGLLAIGVGFAMQNVASNFVSGVILLVERAIKPDDILEVEGVVVRVRALGIRATRVRTRDGEDMIVPNSIIAQSVVKNYTDADTMLRIRVPVGVHYDSDLAVARAALERAIHSVPQRSTERSGDVVLVQFGSSSVDFEVRVWIDDPWEDARVRSDLLQAIWDSLREDHVVIAFPQLDVHFDGPVAAGLAASA